jgi:twitching motility protein PilI
VEPFDLLIEIGRRSQQAARPLPPKTAVRAHWMGLGFTLLGQRLVVPMDEVAELLRVPLVTRVPGVRDWLCGVANVRGRLMTVVDLGVYFGQPSNRPRAQRRILAQEGDDFYYGFLIDESLGMQHFSRETHQAATPEVPASLQRYLRGSYAAGVVTWPVFSLLALGSEIGEARIAL